MSKETLSAYTIAIIQQTLDYHFGQMSIVYQREHNKATLDTPSRAEELATAHFNIALLTDTTPRTENSHDPDNTSPTTVDPAPTAPTEETTPKLVDPSVTHTNPKSQPTGTVPPYLPIQLGSLRRGTYGL